jgi:Glycosyl transferase family 2
MKPLTIIFSTNRDEPMLDWFYVSLAMQLRTSEDISTQVVIQNPKSGISKELIHDNGGRLKMDVKDAKPTVWAGKYRLTTDDWWSKASSLNSGIARTKTEWVCFLDDRCVLLPGWLDRIREQMSYPFPYVLLGAYEKRTGMTVENGVIKNGGIVTGKDGREDYCNQYYVKSGMKPPFKAPSSWCYGCCISMPLEWALQVNGFDETADGLSGEDYIFGAMLENNGFPLRYDPRFKIIEDRTPGQIGPVAIRSDYGISPNDWSHELLNRLKDKKRAQHPIDIRQLRDDTLAGKPWPAPWGPKVHGFDGTPLEKLIPK